MAETTGVNSGEEFGSRLLRAVEAIAIRAEDAHAIAEQYLGQSKEQFPADEDWRHQLRAADKIIGRYSRLAAMVRTASGLPERGEQSWLRRPISTGHNIKNKRKKIQLEMGRNTVGPS